MKSAEYDLLLVEGKVSTHLQGAACPIHHTKTWRLSENLPSGQMEWGTPGCRKCGRRWKGVWPLPDSGLPGEGCLCLWGNLLAFFLPFLSQPPFISRFCLSETRWSIHSSFLLFCTWGCPLSSSSTSAWGHWATWSLGRTPRPASPSTCPIAGTSLPIWGWGEGEGSHRVWVLATECGIPELPLARNINC